MSQIGGITFRPELYNLLIRKKAAKKVSKY